MLSLGPAGATPPGPKPRIPETMRADQAYEELLRRVREEALLTSCEALLEWDEETYMPSGGVENRSEQLALLAGLYAFGEVSGGHFNPAVSLGVFLDRRIAHRLRAWQPWRTARRHRR